MHILCQLCYSIKTKTCFLDVSNHFNMFEQLMISSSPFDAIFLWFEEKINFFCSYRQDCIGVLLGLQIRIQVDPIIKSNISYNHTMAQKISEKLLSGIIAAGSLVASIFLSPPKYIWGVSGLVIAAASAGLLLKQQWVESQPNEWLLIIRNGKLIKAGVGLKTFVGISDTVVKFPSKVEKVEFRANNVTKEMQGVIITGFAFWSVFREDDGPFRCYKYMEGGDANANVQAMCESVLRNLIANSTLDEVLRNRSHLKDNMNKDLRDQFKGWGIWLQTVQITEVTISSDKLFKDLQAEFRQDTRLKAEKIDLTTKQEITKQRQESDMKIAEVQQLNNTKKQQTRNNQGMKRANQQALFDQQKNELEIKRLQRQKDFEIERLKTQLLKEQQRLNNKNNIRETQIVFERKTKESELEFDRKNREAELDYQRKVIELARIHDTVTLQKYQIDAMERIYDKLGIREVKINQFVGGSQQSSLASILPSLGFAMGQIKTTQ